MHALRSGAHGVAVAWCLGLACGSRSDLQVGSTRADVTTFAPHPECATADGVRLCGGSAPCPEIPAPTCPGFGCTHALDVAAAMASGGVCWSDLPDDGRYSCATCDDGDVCIQRGPDALVCVSPHVCEALWDIGVRDVCRYADKSRYDHRPIPQAMNPCPTDPRKHSACGGACGSCKQGTRCVGRSPDHPFGLCTTDNVQTSAEYGPCSIVNGAAATWCQPPGGAQSGWVCAVFHVADPDRDAALRYGLCMFHDECLSTAAAFPGGLECYDVAGKQIR